MRQDTTSMSPLNVNPRLHVSVAAGDLLPSAGVAFTGGILIDEATFEAAKGTQRLGFDVLEPIMVKGKSHPIPIFRPIYQDPKVRCAALRSHRSNRCHAMPCHSFAEQLHVFSFLFAGHSAFRRPSTLFVLIDARHEVLWAHSQVLYTIGREQEMALLTSQIDHMLKAAPTAGQSSFLLAIVDGGCSPLLPLM